MRRIGVIADNHSRTSDGADLPQPVLEAFTGVDLIVHCGDAGSWGTLDRLASVVSSASRSICCSSPVRTHRASARSAAHSS